MAGATLQAIGAVDLGQRENLEKARFGIQGQATMKVPPLKSKSLGRHHTTSQEVNVLAGKGSAAKKVNSRGREHFGFVLVCSSISLFRCFSFQ